MSDFPMAFFARVDRPACYYRVLFVCLRYLDTAEFRLLTAREVAIEAGMALSTAERGLIFLERDGVVIGTGAGARKRRRMNNRVAWTTADPTMPLDPSLIDAQPDGRENAAPPPDKSSSESFLVHGLPDLADGVPKTE